MINGDTPFTINAQGSSFIATGSISEELNIGPFEGTVLYLCVGQSDQETTVAISGVTVSGPYADMVSNSMILILVLPSR